MRTIPELKHYLQPLKDCIKDTFIPSFGCQADATTRKIMPLPARLGGMGLNYLIQVVEDKYKKSRKITLINRKKKLLVNTTMANPTSKKFKSIKGKGN